MTPMPDATPSLTWASRAVPKGGCTAAECEDASAADPDAARFAVADGASESAFAGEWALLLAEAYVADPPGSDGWPAWLAPVRKRWLARVGGRAMPWYLEEKFDAGAFATLLGVELRRGRGGAVAWRAAAVGDSCLFQVRGDKLVRSFPLTSAAEFGSRPALLGSRGGPPAGSPPARREGEARPGDSLLLMTDALAQWFLAEAEAGGKPWRELPALRDEGGFAEWVEARRAAGALRNDDVTLLTIRVDEE